MAGRKRKKKLNPDDDSIVPKISRKSEDKKIQRVGVEGEANMRTAPKKKYVKKGNKSALNSIQGNGGKMKKNKKHGPKSDMHKSTFIKHKRKLLTDINRTESLDKKHEARRKRRAKGKVHVQTVVSVAFVNNSAHIRLLADCKATVGQ